MFMERTRSASVLPYWLVQNWPLLEIITISAADVEFWEMFKRRRILKCCHWPKIPASISGIHKHRFCTLFLESFGLMKSIHWPSAVKNRNNQMERNSGKSESWKFWSSLTFNGFVLPLLKLIVLVYKLLVLLIFLFNRIRFWKDQHNRF